MYTYSTAVLVYTTSKCCIFKLDILPGNHSKWEHLGAVYKKLSFLVKTLCQMCTRFMYQFMIVEWLKLLRSIHGGKSLL